MATILTARAPTVTLTRLQSGVGVLTFEAACSDAVGDLRLGCAYQLVSGATMVQHASGAASAPPSTSPVVIGQRGRYEKLALNLTRIREVSRLVVYAFSDSGRTLTWGGTLVTTTAGHNRIELSLDRPPSQGVLVLQSVYNVAGELVLRAEAEEIPGTVRDACLAFGFDRIMWVDASTPLA